VARLEEADTIITDAGLDPEARHQLATAVPRLILVDVATGERRTIVRGLEDDHSPDNLTSGGRA
jgi:hypothetical protein